MSSVYWSVSSSGNWNTKSDWSGDAEPGASSDVTIAVSSAITVTYSTGADTILSLYTGYNNTLDITGGSLGVLGNSSLSGAIDQSGGTLSLGGKTDLSYAGIQQTAGTLRIASGTLMLGGQGGSFAGTVTGATLDCVNGTVTVGTHAVLSLQQLMLDGSDVMLTGKLTESGLYEQTDGTLSIASTAVLSGTADLMGGSIDGAGVLDLFGTTELAAVDFDGTGSVNNTGDLLQDATFQIDYGAGSASLTNSATGTWMLIGNVNVDANTATTNTLITNRGLLEKLSGGGTSQIDPSFASSGNIELQTGTLLLQGAADSLAGTIGGGGTVEFGAGTTTLEKSLTDTVGAMVLQDGTLDLGASLSYAGTLDAGGGTLSLQSDTLKLSGVLTLSGASLDGKGTIVAAGGIISGGVIKDSVLLQNAGTLVLDGELLVGENSGDTAELQNLSTGTVLIKNSGGVSTNSADAVVNAGTIDKTGNSTSVIGADLESTGTLAVAGGEMVLQGASSVLSGAVTGGGLLEIEAGTTTISGGTTLGIAALTLSYGTMQVEGADSFGGSFSLGDGTLSLAAGSLTLSGYTSLNGGTITATPGGTLALTGATAILGGIYADGSLVIDNTGIITSLSSWVLEGSSSVTPTLDNASGGVLLLSDTGIEVGSGATVVNAGTIAKTLGGAGSAEIYATLVNTGTVSVSQGTLSFLGAVTGSGHFAAGAGTELSFGAAASGGSVALGAYSDLAVNATDGFADTISGFAAGDIIELNGLYYDEPSTAFTFNKTTDQLAVTNGSSSVTLTLSGSYTSNSFALFDDSGIVGVAHT